MVNRRRLAILSNVHGHLQALEAVLADADAAGASEIVVAGDTVNFGPDSAAVVDRLREREARMIRGNHEVELVATWDTPELPPHVRTSPSFAIARWSLEQLGRERLAFLAALPDTLLLDEATVVAHGSPRRVRDAVSAARTDEELAAMLEGLPYRLAFVGHTHRPLIRDLPASGETPVRRFVNVGSVGFNLDGDVCASYALVESGASGEPGDWRVELRRVAYDVQAAVAAYDNGLRDACPEVVELFVRQLRTARAYFGPWLRSAAGLPDEELVPSMRRFLAENP
jgi:diadenosine tetraphosphatase ApaH/serine/threonine PP2A family protein phosphatase